MVLVVKRRTRALASYGRRRPNVALYRSWMLTERAFGQSESVHRRSVSFASQCSPPRRRRTRSSTLLLRKSASRMGSPLNPFHTSDAFALMSGRAKARTGRAQIVPQERGSRLGQRLPAATALLSAGHRRSAGRSGHRQQPELPAAWIVDGANRRGRDAGERRRVAARYRRLRRRHASPELPRRAVLCRSPGRSTRRRSACWFPM
jgi:hypothetical protein